MRTLTEQLTMYAAYHRDRRNIATHFVGVPMIVVAIAGFLSRPTWFLGALPLSPALAVTFGLVVFYLLLDLRYGAAMTGFMAVALWLGTRIAAQSTGAWLALSIGLFVVGWAIQFVGHAFEGRKPAFVDDVVGLLVGPLFVVAEAGFALGLRQEVRETVDSQTTVRSGG